MTAHSFAKGTLISLYLYGSFCFSNNFTPPPGFEAGSVAPQDQLLVSILPPPAVEISPAESFSVEITLKSSKPAYRVGENLEFSIKVDTDCYLTLINEGQSGASTVLFPNKDRRVNLVKSGETYPVPGEYILPVAALRVSKPKQAIRDYEHIEAICRTTDQDLFFSGYDFNKYKYRVFQKDEDWRSEIKNVPAYQESRESLRIQIN